MQPFIGKKGATLILNSGLYLLLPSLKKWLIFKTWNYFEIEEINLSVSAILPW